MILNVRKFILSSFQTITSSVLCHIRFPPSSGVLDVSVLGTLSLRSQFPVQGFKWST